MVSVKFPIRNVSRIVTMTQTLSSWEKVYVKQYGLLNRQSDEVYFVYYVTLILWYTAR